MKCPKCGKEMIVKKSIECKNTADCPFGGEMCPCGNYQPEEKTVYVCEQCNIRLYD
jgi:hypothetical protein